VMRANEYLGRGQVEEATQLLATPPKDLAGHPQITQLLGEAEQKRAKKVERQDALEKTLSLTQSFFKQESFTEAIAALGAFEARHGTDARVDHARRETEEAQQEAERKRQREEQARIEAERAKAEAERVKAEAERVRTEAEHVRVEAELKRKG